MKGLVVNMTKIYRGLTNNGEQVEGVFKEMCGDTHMWITDKFGSWVAISLESAKLIREF